MKIFVCILSLMAAGALLILLWTSEPPGDKPVPTGSTGSPQSTAMPSVSEARRTPGTPSALAPHSQNPARKTSFSDAPPTCPEMPEKTATATHPRRDDSRIRERIQTAKMRLESENHSGAAAIEIPTDGEAANPEALPPVHIPLSPGDPGAPATLPAILAPVSPSDPDARTIDRLLEDFTDALPAGFPQARDPAYQRAWLDATEEADARYKALHGVHAWSIRHIEANRELHGEFDTE